MPVCEAAAVFQAIEDCQIVAIDNAPHEYVDELLINCITVIRVRDDFADFEICSAFEVLHGRIIGIAGERVGVLVQFLSEGFISADLVLPYSDRKSQTIPVAQGLYGYKNFIFADDVLYRYK
jgi:hypothetical protein